MDPTQYTPEQIKTALGLAYDAGDKEAIDDLTNLLRMQQGMEYSFRKAAPSLPPPSAEGAKLASEMTHTRSTRDLPMNETGIRPWARAGANAVGFGFQDEAAGAMGATLNSMFGATPDSWTEAYANIRDAERDQQDRFRMNHGAANVALEATGAMVPGRALARPFSAATDAFGAIRTVPAAGAGAGFTGALGHAEGTPAEQLKQAALGAGIGAAGASIMHPAAAVGRGVAEYGARASRPALSVDERVRSVLRDEQAAAGVSTGQQVGELRAREGAVPGSWATPENPPVTPGMLPEYQPLTRGRLAPSGAGREAADQLALGHPRRQSQELGRVIREIAQEQGVSVNARASVDQINRIQRRQARPLYREAYELDTQPIQVPQLAEQLKDPVVLRALAEGRSLLALEGKRPRRLLKKVGEDENGEPVYRLTANPTWQEIDLIQRGMRNKAVTYRESDPNRARLWRNRREDFLGIVDIANPKLAQARQVWAQGEALKDALERGRQIFSNSRKQWDADDMAFELQSYTPSEKQAFLTGVVKELRRAVESSRQQNNNAGQAQFSSIENLSRLRQILGDEGTDRLMREIERTGGNVAAARRNAQQSGTPESLQATSLDDAAPGGTLRDMMRYWGSNARMANDPALMRRLNEVLLRYNADDFETFMRTSPFSLRNMGGTLWDTIASPAQPSVAAGLLAPQAAAQLMGPQ